MITVRLSSEICEEKGTEPNHFAGPESLFKEEPHATTEEFPGLEGKGGVQIKTQSCPGEPRQIVL